MLLLSANAPTNPFLINSKKSDNRHVQRTRPKHGRRSYLSEGIGCGSQSLLEWEPLRSKYRGLLSYNIEDRCIRAATLAHAGMPFFPKMILVHLSATPLGRMPESRLTFNPRLKCLCKLSPHARRWINFRPRFSTLD